MKRASPTRSWRRARASSTRSSIRTRRGAGSRWACASSGTSSSKIPGRSTTTSRYEQREAGKAAAGRGPLPVRTAGAVTFQGENIFVGLVALALLPLLGLRIVRGLREGILPLYRTRIAREDGRARFIVLLVLH